MASTAEGISRPALKGPERLCSELQASWQVLSDLAASLSETSSPLHTRPAASGLSEAREQYETSTRLLVVEPLQQCMRLRPISQSLEAMRAFDRDAASAAVLIRAKIDGQFQTILSEAALDLCEPWRIWRSRGNEKEWNAWEGRRTARAKRASALLNEYAQWAGKSKNSAANTGKMARIEKRRELWWRQESAVRALLEMELSFRDLGLAWLTRIEELERTLRAERAEALSVTQKMVDWMGKGAEAGVSAPVASIQLATPEERLRGWIYSLEQEAEKRFLEGVELIQPGKSPVWRSVRVRRLVLTDLANSAHGPVRRAVEQYWEQTATIVREIGRSQEIINYWRVAATDTSTEQLFAEARHNATTVLLDQLQTPGKDELDAKLIDAFQAWLEQGSTTLEIAQSGWMKLLGQPRGRQVLVRATLAGKQTARKALQRASGWTANQWDRALEVLGSKVPAQPMTEPIIRRATLRDTLALPASKGALPATYGLLFRLAPVEDRRFLVGRDQELTGLEQALKDWDSGRFAACLFIGARGSGKTSLLNCAANSVFRGRELIRTQFVERVLSRQALDNFLRNLLQIEEHADLEAAFAAQRRILMIEESERTYLRKVGGFEGAEHLLGWIQRTASTTLWVIVMNDRAFRVLEAGARFGRVFSHRINAMSVSRGDLENAILERHRLSGLRLEFAPPPVGDPRVNRIKRWLGLEYSPRKLFFDSLYQQSGGVFRSAFELWLSSIADVQGETLKIRQPLEPAFGHFRKELAQEDHFTLLAIQEHGSLTPSELAEVLCADEDIMYSRLGRLSALGLIERDPDHLGWRVKPEAQRFTTDLLRRVNLA